MMEKLITIKGTGNFVKSPDLVEIFVEFNTQNENYQNMLDEANGKIEELTLKLIEQGFEKDSLKTTNYYVNTVFDNVKDKKGNYKKVFVGYTCTQNMVLRFDFDREILSKAVNLIASCNSHPKFNINFTLKNKDEVGEELLRSATENAYKSAKIMCETAGHKLGSLVRIDYDWTEIDVYSNTKYDCAVEMKCSCASYMTPDDISLDDTATFIWEIV